MSVAEQFAGLDMKSLIGGPLTAAADASILLARSTADFINDVGFDANGKVRTAAFGYERRSANDDGTSNLEEMKVAVPMLAIVPIPNLQIDEVNVLFDMEVKQSEKSEKSTDLGASLSGSAKFGPVKVSITGSVSSHSSNTRSSDNSAKYHVDVKATNHGMPEGLSRVLDMMAACISPTLVSSELKDGNGQNLTDAARAKAENMKRLRGEIMTLETQLNAARNGLESNIQRIRSTAESQQNAYQAALTRLLGNLGDSDTDKEKADTYGDAMDEVNQSWTAFRSRTAELVKLVADSGEANDGVSDLLGLKAFDSKSGQAAVYAEGEAQYKALAALMKSAIESQKTYDSAEEGLLSKRAEYNNAVSGALPASSGSNAGGTPGSGSV
ncbi:MAG: DUF2589 domain-containing protein [Lachnospiraceae bacterium]|nr:DUF2589 domain-containing protein [uncultured Acetatifactor sp.]MCI8542070.1 DUF2589 domain-containing protein [Lachnospiraceae bacterium]